MTMTWTDELATAGAKDPTELMRSTLGARDTLLERATPAEPANGPPPPRLDLAGPFE